jgi:hypothetical protein
MYKREFSPKKLIVGKLLKKKIYLTKKIPKFFLPLMKKIVQKNYHVLVAKLLQLIIMMIFNI